jgi:hypothetical protein
MPENWIGYCRCVVGAVSTRLVSVDINRKRGPILDDSVDKFHLRCSILGNSKPGSEEPNDAPHGLRTQVSEEDIASAISG